MSIRIQLDVEEVTSVRQGKNGSIYVSFKSNGGSFQAVLSANILIEAHHSGIMNIVGESKTMIVPGFNGGQPRPQSFIQPQQIVGWIDRGPVFTDFDNFFQSMPISSSPNQIDPGHRYPSSDAGYPGSDISQESSPSAKLKDSLKK